jgi:SP family general alpha glucoside:H+ symporter-like MFS transporter
MGALALSLVAITVEVISTTNPVFFAGKILNGVAVGVLASVCSVYVGEVSTEGR